MTYPFSHAHQDAGKDATQVVYALAKSTDQQINILHNFGATAATCQRTRDIIQNALMLAVETVIAARERQR